MSWDIYGQPLRPGFCEVHPDVAHPYPCWCCEQDAERYSEERREQEHYDRLLQAAYERHMDTEYEAVKFEAGSDHG